MAEGIFKRSAVGTVLAAGTAAALATMMTDAGQPAVADARITSQSSVPSTIEVLSPVKGPTAWLDGEGRKVHLTLRKRSGDDDVRVYHTLTDRLGRRAALTVVPPQFSLKQDQITEQTLRIEGSGDLEGAYSGKLLLIATKEVESANVPLSITASRPPAYADHLLLLGAALALLSVSGGALLALHRFGWLLCMRDVVWASNSWATNITVASGVLTALLAFVSANDARLHLTQGGYQLLATAFGVPALLAPVLFNAFRKGCKSSLQGISIGFILASTATMLAAQLQLVLLLAMLDDLNRAAVLTPLLMQCVQAVAGAAILGLIVYANVSIYTSIRGEAQQAPPGAINVGLSHPTLL